MRKLPLLLALLAVPAQAQDARVYYASDSWPVLAEGRACTMTLASDPEHGADALRVRYDAAAQEVTLTVVSEVSDRLSASGALEMNIIFLENGREKFDDAWGKRTFAYVRDGDMARFSTRFGGEENVRQILADLAGSAWLGLKYKQDEPISYGLTGAAGSLSRLRECAASAAA